MVYKIISEVTCFWEQPKDNYKTWVIQYWATVLRHGHSKWNELGLSIDEKNILQPIYVIMQGKKQKMT